MDLIILKASQCLSRHYFQETHLLSEKDTVDKDQISTVEIQDHQFDMFLAIARLV